MMPQVLTRSPCIPGRRPLSAVVCRRVVVAGDAIGCNSRTAFVASAGRPMRAKNPRLNTSGERSETSAYQPSEPEATLAAASSSGQCLVLGWHIPIYPALGTAKRYTIWLSASRTRSSFPLDEKKRNRFRAGVNLLPASESRNDFPILSRRTSGPL